MARQTNDGARERTILRASGAEKGPGELVRTSVTQIATFDASQDGGCPTKWWLNKVDERPMPATKAQGVGIEGHTQLEHYLTTGEDVLGPIARAGKHLLPPRSPQLHVERELRATIGGVALIGYTDVLNASGVHVDEQGPHVDPAGTVEILDHKFTSDMKWAKAGSALVRTVQMPVYAKIASDLHPGGEFARLSHIYYQTKGAPRAEKRSALVPLTTINDRWAKVESTVREMKDAAREGDVEKLPKNYNACGAFGGCPFRESCPRPASVVLATLLGKGNAMSLLDKIRSNNTPAAPAPVVAQAPAAPPPSAPVIAAAATAVQAPPPAQPETKCLQGTCGRMFDAPCTCPSSVFAAPPSPAPVAPAKPAGGLLSRIKAPAAAAPVVAAAPAPEPARPGGLLSKIVGAYPAAPERPAPVAAAPERRNILVRDAKMNHVYTVQTQNGPVKAAFIARTKGGFSFGPLGAPPNSSFLLPEDAVVTDENERLDIAPIPEGVVAPDAPKSGESGPKATPFEPTQAVPPEVRAAAEELAAEAAESVEAAEAAPTAESDRRFIAAVPTPAEKPTQAQRYAETQAEKAAAEARGETPARRRAGRPTKYDAAKKRIEEAKAMGLAPLPADLDYVALVDASRAEEAAKQAAKAAAESAPAPASVAVPYGSASTAVIPGGPPMMQHWAESKPGTETTVPTVATIHEAPESKVLSKVEPFALYLDAMPVRGAKAEDLDPVIEKWCKALCEAAGEGAADVRCAPQQSALGFGKWKGALAAIAKENAPESGAWFLLGVGESEIRSVVAEALTSKASVVVRGV